MDKKRKIDSQRRGKKRPKLEPELPGSVDLRTGSNEEVLLIETQELLAKAAIERKASPVAERQPKIDGEVPFVPFEIEESSEETKLESSTGHQDDVDEVWQELEYEVIQLSSTGDGLALTPRKDRVVVIPFTVAGDKVIAKAYKRQGPYSLADFIKVIEPSPLRQGVTPQCKYFSSCSGCQLQMISYDDQLAHKKTIVENAFKHFSGLPSDAIPAIGSTMPSPLQYAYRTKLSPHFTGPRPGKWRADKPAFETVPNIGFNQKGGQKILDIESCPIGTEIVQEGLKFERAKVASKLRTYKTGATILIRESTQRIPNKKDSDGSAAQEKPSFTPPPTSVFAKPRRPSAAITPPATSKELIIDSETKRPELRLTYPTYTDIKTHISDERAQATEHVGPYSFSNFAGSFFQNNSSILGPFTSYIHRSCIPPSPILDPSNPTPPIKYLLDAYCGSGLFAITLSSLFSSVLGIDIDRRSIEAARLNAERNHVQNAGFIDADAANLFADVPFPADQTLCVIDPPRKGASEDFLQQMCRFGPRRVVYVSCNVHTQARDVGMLCRGFENQSDTGISKWKYEIESLRGFDFFPQTGHVEGVCLLNRVERK